MSRSSAFDRRGAGCRGFTLLELLVYMTLVSVVMASVFKLIVSQNRSYRHQQEFIDVRDNLRSAMVVLTSELRQLSAAGGDLYAVGADSIVLRSVHWWGVVCEKHNVLPRYGMSGLAGEIDAILADSALVFAAGGIGVGDDGWRPIDFAKYWHGGSGGVAGCAWTTAVDGVVEVKGDTTGIRIGAPIRGFRRVQYGAFSEGSRWWLGRKLRASTEYQKLAGPLLPPVQGGLVFSFFDSTGAATADPAAVHTVEIEVRGESYGKVRGSRSDAPAARRDSLRTRTFLRG